MQWKFIAAYAVEFFEVNDVNTVDACFVHIRGCANEFIQVMDVSQIVLVVYTYYPYWGTTHWHNEQLV